MIEKRTVRLGASKTLGPTLGRPRHLRRAPALRAGVDRELCLRGRLLAHELAEPWTSAIRPSRTFIHASRTVVAGVGPTRDEPLARAIEQSRALVLDPHLLPMKRHADEPRRLRSRGRSPACSRASRLLRTRGARRGVRSTTGARRSPRSSPPTLLRCATSSRARARPRDRRAGRGATRGPRETRLDRSRSSARAPSGASSSTATSEAPRRASEDTTVARAGRGRARCRRVVAARTISHRLGPSEVGSARPDESAEISSSPSRRANATSTEPVRGGW